MAAADFAQFEAMNKFKHSRLIGTFRFLPISLTKTIRKLFKSTLQWSAMVIFG